MAGAARVLPDDLFQDRQARRRSDSDRSLERRSPWWPPNAVSSGLDVRGIWYGTLCYSAKGACYSAKWLRYVARDVARVRVGGNRAPVPRAVPWAVLWNPFGVGFTESLATDFTDEHKISEDQCDLWRSFFLVRVLGALFMRPCGSFRV